MTMFRIKTTVKANLEMTKLDKSDNLELNGTTILKQLPNGELLEHLGYFHQLAKDLKLPYEPLLNEYKQHRLNLVKKNENA